MKIALGKHDATADYLATLGGCMLRRPRSRRKASFIRNLTIDSRSCDAGSLFIALPGSRSDGHLWIPDAISRGATTVLLHESRCGEFATLLDRTGTWALVAKEPLHALYRMATEYVSLLNGVTTIGITGSCGKTTTKEMLASILSQEFPTVKTPGNYNSTLGLPLSLMQIGDHHKYGVFEMGIDHIGEMDTMLGMLAPNHAVLTNIGISHAEKLGSISAIMTEKGKLLKNARNGYFMGMDEPSRKAMEHIAGHPQGFWGIHATEGVTGIRDEGLLGWTIIYQGTEIHVPAIGKHSLKDALAAISVARHLGVGEEFIKHGLEKVENLEGRSRVVSGDVTVIEDYYNAAASSTTSILDFMAATSWKGDKKVVLGDMKELGRYSDRAHEMIGRRLLLASPSSVFLYGTDTKKTWNILRSGGYAGQLVYSDDEHEVNRALERNIHRGDLVLVKGSRGMAMEKFLPVITAKNAILGGDRQCYA
ncbi:UDP-N-acetylmuramoyl-tripeptide--D-alanyl-D-alanine ligase [Parasphaerochaeta coccoides]|uniref:UDP-N-acetylmuramoyl-tripeptide--D-alanyl-D-alanine ligase n=1 Tax=Parasphaerochaeta coccoides (strain ATCC BAA-1237 / DSM 17374 / SPN1) TaxID=760011 RepID=F4GKW8_PARC1|nr:UDP-N-acetylmuramoyl-tripeptide--D-alanyl-D-alanine ligase [Parasphaerochaeta coccoides]AEC01881.1 UDP-N-acetylmuramoylalanyl-D-glutamyl-2,6-diamin opimelate/D-alanyl-D-alanyl ligase [Parasphaerochaeta coccoides DSM 17374]